MYVYLYNSITTQHNTAFCQIKYTISMKYRNKALVQNIYHHISTM